MGIEVAIILGLASLFGTIVGVATNQSNNQFIDEMNKENQQFQEQTNLQNHQWSLEAAQWEYEHEKPQRQYADLLATGITPAAAAQKVSGANVSYSPATAVAPHNMPKSTNMLNDSLMQVVDDITNYSSMAQAQASADKTNAETKVITETAINKANAEIEKILADTLKSYSDIKVNDSLIGLNEANTGLAQANTGLAQANTDLVNEKVDTEQVNRQSIELSNKEKEIQLEFTKKTLEMSLKKTEAEIKFLAQQTAKLKAEVNSVNFDNEYKKWRNSYIETYGVAPEQGWEDTLFKAIIDGKAGVMLDAFSESLFLLFGTSADKFNKWFDGEVKKSEEMESDRSFEGWLKYQYEGGRKFFKDEPRVDKNGNIYFY